MKSCLTTLLLCLTAQMWSLGKTQDERAKNIEALLSGKNERVKLAAEKLVGLLVESIESGVK